MPIFLIFLSLCMGQVSWAYIPRTQSIVKKMTSNNGRREYSITRNVQINSGEDQIQAREKWTIANGDKMKLEVSSLDPNQNWKFVILYGPRQRRTLSSKNKVKAYKKSREFFEPLFHDRYHPSLLKRLVGFQFIPQWIIDNPPPTLVEGETKMTPEPFVSLQPIEGRVNYRFGANSNQSGGNAQTRLWVEQDSFLIRKAVLNSSAEFVNSDFQTYVGGLRLPRKQQVRWKNRVARINIQQVVRSRSKAKDWKLTAKDSGTLPTHPLIKEFYSRFR